ncbi:Ribosome production factor [Penicillium macrosclerotiorum]|uniref:Ribosome production factor n=1 Tax=Penicillium macrosclerotiorum TaxID=303699 RepID=UPI0025499991|nr:Ribosome production factor [Penicillium macrosclerotiorum]KAJ5664714.1 Ribosome production factor [Penicillium macrosclerotiorum]
MLREVKAKNPRTARILKAREPQLIEGPKKTLILHGTKCPQALDTVLKTFHSLTKPHSVLFHKKNENIHPFENTESMEFLANKNECGLMVFGSSNKKRPNCITLARIFNSQLLDMCEMLLLPPQDPQAIPPINELVMHVGLGLRPMMLFAGSLWEDPTSSAHVMLKSFFLDMFKGEETNQIDVEGLQYVLMVGAEEPRDNLSPVIHLRWYKVITKRSGHKLPRVELEEVGPKFDFKIGRMRSATPEAMKEAMKQGKRPNEEIKMKKNISMDLVGDKVGRVHLGKQDLGGLQTRKMKGLKRRAGVESDEEDEEMMDVDEISEDEGHKRARVD